MTGCSKPEVSCGAKDKGAWIAGASPVPNGSLTAWGASPIAEIGIALAADSASDLALNGSWLPTLPAENKTTHKANANVA
jgi:hypothetical protein